MEYYKVRCCGGNGVHTSEESGQVYSVHVYAQNGLGIKYTIVGAKVEKTNYIYR